MRILHACRTRWPPPGRRSRSGAAGLSWACQPSRDVTVITGSSPWIPYSEARLAHTGCGIKTELSKLSATLPLGTQRLVVGCAHQRPRHRRERNGLAAPASARQRCCCKRQSFVYDKAGFVAGCVTRVPPHVAGSKRRWSALDGLTIRHGNYGATQRPRKATEEPFGWMKMIGGLRRLTARRVAPVESPRLTPDRFWEAAREFVETAEGG